MSITTEGRYTQFCTFCGNEAGRTDNLGGVDVICPNCVGLPQPWSRGRGGLYGTDARYDELGDIADGEGPDEDEDEDDEGSYEERWDTGNLRAYEVDDLGARLLETYNRNRERLGLPTLAR